MKFGNLRRKLFDDYIKNLGISDERVLRAFLKVPREEFVPLEYKDQAYFDAPLPIGFGQTISQPSLVAFMTQSLQLKGGEKVLEVGTGSGFQAAILSKLARDVYSVERIEKLARGARLNLKRLGFHNVYVTLGNGSLGLKKEAPFDAIMVTAAAPSIPEQLVKQLKEGGRIVIPVGEDFYDQRLKVGVKKKGKLELQEVQIVNFVPLITKHETKKSVF